MIWSEQQIVSTIQDPGAASGWAEGLFFRERVFGRVRSRTLRPGSPETCRAALS